MVASDLTVIGKGLYTTEYMVEIQSLISPSAWGVMATCRDMHTAILTHDQEVERHPKHNLRIRTAKVRQRLFN
jgi:hypothetical protein